MAAKILIVEDEPAISEMVEMALSRANFEVVKATNAEEAILLLRDTLPALVLLDWMLPGTSGVEFARRIKKDGVTSHIPIIMLTAKGEEADKVYGLDAGADDYITKPFSPRELIARIRAVLRRAAPLAEQEIIEVDNLLLDTASHRISVNGELLELGPTEYRLLHFFMTHPERVYSRGQLLDSVWGSNVYVEERTVDVHIRRLRKALTPYGHERYVQTVRSAGYRFSTKV
ncbi:MAG TPA: phosphate regulon transcriptional regulatory protein PhoB [Chromatiales bacterium]|nr:phosphate regulon transcriptional regulatory protein PhoB [Chromatiales bacterium]